MMYNALIKRSLLHLMSISVICEHCCNQLAIPYIEISLSFLHNIIISLNLHHQQATTSIPRNSYLAEKRVLQQLIQLKHRLNIPLVSFTKIKRDFILFHPLHRCQWQVEEVTGLIHHSQHREVKIDKYRDLLVQNTHSQRRRLLG